MITQLQENQIFVFGSNLAGRHGKGAAKYAIKFGAKYGVGRGLMGHTYAIPTKDRNLKVLPLYKIQEFVNRFIMDARQYPSLEFLVTEIGCGLAGYKPHQIAPLFHDPPNNVKLPKSFTPLA